MKNYDEELINKAIAILEKAGYKLEKRPTAIEAFMVVKLDSLSWRHDF